MRCLFYILFSLLFIPNLIFSQDDKNARIIIDTVNSNGFDIILFENNTWEYINQDSVLAVIKFNDSIKLYNDIYENRLLELDSLTVFSENWDTINIFAFGKADYKRTLDTCAISLLNNGEEFFMPYIGTVISRFGWRRGYHHNGIDIRLKTGDTIVSAFDGIVRYAGWNRGGYGYLVIIRHYNGIETYYAHLSKLLCQRNQEVKAGDTIARGGNTGKSYGPHLHFETRFKDNPFNPELIIDFENNKLKSDTLVLMPEEFAYLKSRRRTSGGVSGVLEGNYHIVYSGDTLWAISRKYNISISQICSMNGISEDSKLQIGQKIRVK